MAVLFLIFLDQIRTKWIKLDQNGFLTNQKMDKKCVLMDPKTSYVLMDPLPHVI